MSTGTQSATTDASGPRDRRVRHFLDDGQTDHPAEGRACAYDPPVQSPESAGAIADEAATAARSA